MICLYYLNYEICSVIFRKKNLIVATRCQILRLKCTNSILPARPHWGSFQHSQTP